MFKFNNLGLAIAMSLKFYISVARRLKLKFKKFWGLVPTFLEVTGEKLVGGLFAPPPILNSVNKLKSGIKNGIEVTLNLS